MREYSTRVRAGLVIVVLSALTLACSGDHETAWDQHLISVSAEPLETGDDGSLVVVDSGLSFLSGLQGGACFDTSNPNGHNGPPQGRLGSNGQTDYEFFRELFGDEQSVDVVATDGAWRLTLAPPYERSGFSRVTCGVSN